MKRTQLQQKGKGLSSKREGLGQRSSLKNTKSFEKVSKKISFKSTKQKSIDKQLKKVYDEMDSRDNLWCTGCGSTSNLQHSHLIPRSKRRDLVAVKENITFHCDICHTV